MAHEIHDDGFHEIQLSGKQLVFLFMATTVVSIVIFLCGVLVGRGVQHGRGTIAEAAGLEGPTAAGADDDTAMAPTSDKPTPVTGLSYPQSLTAQNSSPATVQPGAADDVGRVRSTSAPVEAAPTASAPAPIPDQVAPAPKEPAAPKAVPAAPAAPAVNTAAPAPAEDGGFTVQVTALKSRPEADAIARRLQSRGYQAYVVAPAAGGQVIYKVRVGMNMQRPEADTVMRRLQNEEKFKPWITR
jgi:cell division septation protein DedD